MFKILIFFGWSIFVQASDYTVGFVPTSFPRDPLEVNQYDEHVILGQILEPLVDSDGNGRVVPSVAKEWHFHDQGKKLIFEIDSSIRFSNGKNVTAVDVVYSINRHITFQSQSKNFLNDIEEVKALSPNQVAISLKKGDVAILKILSRDQLGIVPNGWVFNTTSESPFVGTGPYILRKINSDWYLEKNSHYTRAEINIKKWKLIFFKDANFGIPQILPDLAPDITKGILEQIKLHPTFQDGAYEVSPKFGFTQTSFWIHPGSRIYKDAEKQRLSQKFVNAIVDDYCKEIGADRSTGMIPIGIQGSLSAPVAISKYEKSKLLEKLKIAAPAGIFSDMLSAQRISKIKEKYGVSIDVFFRSPGELKKMQEWKPDVVAGSWAGGYNDPTGFLSLLTGLLGVNFEAYLGPIGKILSQAEVEQSMQKRTDLFRKLGIAVIEDGLLTPGWRVPSYELRKKPLEAKEFQTRYTPRLINFSVGK